MLSWIGMIVLVFAAALGYVAQGTIRRRVDGVRGTLFGAAAFAAICGAGLLVVWVLRSIDELGTVEVLSSEQPLGITVLRPAAIQTETADDGTHFLRLRGSPSPVLAVRTIGATSGRPTTQLYREAMLQEGATEMSDFTLAPLPFAPRANGARWRTASGRGFAWLITRPGPVTTILQCVAPLDADPRTACDALLAAITLDPHFRARTYRERAQ